mmetsp:Transcript_7559/g.17310  ORF Transcript_7559/g.17310 Transcript_7559/m.17310 type:complete len:280 (+) Transcript_7559:588-1427(+)
MEGRREGLEGVLVGVARVPGVRSQVRAPGEPGVPPRLLAKFGGEASITILLLVEPIGGSSSGSGTLKGPMDLAAAMTPRRLCLPLLFPLDLGVARISSGSGLLCFAFFDLSAAGDAGLDTIPLHILALDIAESGVRARKLLNLDCGVATTVFWSAKGSSSSVPTPEPSPLPSDRASVSLPPPLLKSGAMMSSSEDEESLLRPVARFNLPNSRPNLVFFFFFVFLAKMSPPWSSNASSPSLDSRSLLVETTEWKLFALVLLLLLPKRGEAGVRGDACRLD